jgi:sec-independent protein translocase protein TatC
MATEPDETPPEEWEEDEGGGPVKSFLEHLEDLRWTLIKVAASVLIAMMACLVGAPYLVRLIELPLERAGLLLRDTSSGVLPVVWGTNFVGSINRTNPPYSYSRELQASNVSAVVVAPRVLDGGIVLTLVPADPGFVVKPPIKTYSPLSGPMVAIKMALYGGLLLSLPFVLFFLAEFVFPALKAKEKQFVQRALAVGGGLFASGVAFCYFILLPIALAGTIAFSNWLGFAADEWRAEDFISFICLMLLVVGVSFELPIPILVLVKLGIIDYRTLGKFRSYWIVIELVICAMLTPSADPFTMILMALPLHALYEISYLIARYWAWKDARKPAAE